MRRKGAGQIPTISEGGYHPDHLSEIWDQIHPLLTPGGILYSKRYKSSTREGQFRTYFVEWAIWSIYKLLYLVYRWNCVSFLCQMPLHTSSWASRTLFPGPTGWPLTTSPPSASPASGIWTRSFLTAKLIDQLRNYGGPPTVCSRVYRCLPAFSSFRYFCSYLLPCIFMQLQEFQEVQFSSNVSLCHECLLHQNASTECLWKSLPAVEEEVLSSSTSLGRKRASAGWRAAWKENPLSLAALPSMLTSCVQPSPDLHPQELGWRLLYFYFNLFFLRVVLL